MAPSGSSSTFANFYTWCASSCSSATPAYSNSICYDPNAATGSGVHDILFTNDGNVVAVTGGCFSTFANAAAFWEVNSGTVLGLSTSSPYSTWDGALQFGGHGSLGNISFITPNDPHPNIRVASPVSTTNLAAYSTLFTFPSGASGSGGFHGAWPANTDGDANYWLLESANSVTPTTPTYLENEIFGISVASGSTNPVRFGSSYATGTSANFSCLNGIGYPSQDGKWWFFTTDDLNNLGLDANSNPLCSIYVYALDGPASAVTAPYPRSLLSGVIDSIPDPKASASIRPAVLQ